MDRAVVAGVVPFVALLAGAFYRVDERYEKQAALNRRGSPERWV